jgi:signal transduction histidine kinase
VLRREDESEDLSPQPGLEQVPLLVEQVRRAGLPVTVETSGDPVGLPAGVDLCAYRIVQEGLTNALKHAGEARAAVTVRYGPRELEVEIRDERAPDARVGATERLVAGAAGHGLLGMRERVALYGGELEAGPDGHGFRVRARLPLP